jgi:hypothetical protein
MDLTLASLSFLALLLVALAEDVIPESCRPLLAQPLWPLRLPALTMVRRRGAACSRLRVLAASPKCLRLDHISPSHRLGLSLTRLPTAHPWEFLAATRAFIDAGAGEL